MQRLARLLLLLTVCFIPPALQAQVSSATISGSVTDASGAIVPHTTVIATDQATGVKIKAESNDAGQYTLPLLPPGTYTITVEVAGFHKYDQKDLALSGGDHSTVDIALQIGDTSQTVEVTTESATLGTSDASIGQVVTTKQVEDLPLNGRTPMTFAQYSPGVIATTNPAGVHAYDNSAVAGFSVAGLPNKNSEILMDGSPDNASDNAPAYSPPIDATREVRLNVFESDAAYGHSGGGVANQITKSGTNRIHGSLFEFNQISALNSNGYFQKRTTNPKAVTRYNQFGGSVGGPVFFPKLFDGRDKLFFFGAYEGIRTPFPGGFFTSVPTAAERTGDFSALLGQATTTTTICTGHTITHDRYQLYSPTGATPDPSCPGVYDRTPIAGNKIATVNPIASALFNYIPLPNITGTSLGANNYYGVSQGQDHYDNQFGRLDYSAGTRNKLYITGRHNERDQTVNQTFGTSNIAYGDVLQRINWGGSLGDVIAVSPTTVAEVRLNYTRYQQTSLQHSDGFQFSTLGFPAGLQAASLHSAFPMFILNSGFTPSPGTTSMTPGTAPFNSYGIYGDVIKSFGRHTVKAGLDLRKFQKGQATYANGSTSESGRYVFDNTYNRATTASESQFIGQDIAAVELGTPSSGTFDQYATAVGNQTYMSFFVQDDFRVSSNLVLNLGLRFDKDFSPIERNGKAVNGFNITAQNPVGPAAISAYSAHPLAQLPASQFAVNGGLTFASASDKRFSQFTSNMFSPRFGFAYSPHVLGKETVIRGGFGMFVVPIFPFNNSISQQGFSQQTVESTGNITPATTISNPFPNGLVAPTGASAGLSTFVGNSLSIISPVIRNGYSERFTLDVQRIMPGRVLAEVAYIGNVTHRLPISQFPNFVKPQFESTSITPNTALNTLVANPFQGLLPNSGTLNGATVTTRQLLTVYPEFPQDGITIFNVPAGSSSFHALEVRGERRIQHGVTFIANYQFSKLMEAVTYLNNSDPRPEYRISQYDRPHHLVIGVTYDLPFGRGREYGGKAPLWAQIPLGGWIVNSLYLMQSGAPLTWGNVVPFDVKNIHYNPRQATQLSATQTGSTVSAFDVTQFDRNGNDQPQNNIRTFPTQFSTLRTDRLMNWDASILKNFNFTENTYFQFRLEAFNVANRPSFAGPNLSPTSTSFGQITGTQNGQRVMQLGGRIIF